MKKSKETQIAKSNRGAIAASIPRNRSLDQSQNFKGKLVNAIAVLHSEVESINLLIELRCWKIGTYLFALKGLSGHGHFKDEFEITLGHVMSFRQGERYMAETRRIASHMPTLRARLKDLKPHSDTESDSDEEVLKAMPPEELRAILGAGKSIAGKVAPLLLPVAQSLSPEFVQILAALVQPVACLLSTEPLEIEPTLFEEVRVGSDPLQGLTAWPSSVLAISGLNKQSSNWISDLIPVATRATESETLVVVPMKHLAQVHQLFDLPNLLIPAERLFALTTKHIPSHFVVSFISRPERSRAFTESFAKLGIVKVPASV